MDFHSNRGRTTTLEAHSGHPLPTSPEVMETEPIFDSGSYKTAFKKKSTFIPPKHRNSSIDTYCRLVESEVSLLLSKKSQHKVANNLSKTQRNALLELKKDMSVVVQSADKGGAIVVQDRDDYIGEILRQLASTEFYKRLNTNPTLEFKEHIHSVLSHYLDNGDNGKSEYEYMKVDSPVTPVIYTLPKIHKSYTTVPPGRPIISGIGSLTEKMSGFVDSFLRPYVSSLPSYVRDSSDFIQVIQALEAVNRDTILVTFDVESLYTNIPHQGGLEAIAYFLNQRTEQTPSTACLQHLTELVLTKNFFLFENCYYLQTSGTAMGSKMAPNYANLYVGLLEKNCILNPEYNHFLRYIQLWKRYIDDVFVIWTGPATELIAFHSFLNNCCEHLNFTMTSDSHQMNFLDILILKVDDHLSTELYRKPTDRNSLIHAESYHPMPLKKGLPIGQFKRIRRICSTDESFKVHSKDLQTRLGQRGYPDKWIQPAFHRFQNSSQHDCLAPRQKNTEAEQRLNCLIQYSPLGGQFEKVIKKHWHILSSDPSLGNCFTVAPRIVHRRPPNLRNLLVRSHLQQPTPSHFLAKIPDGNYKCGKCAQCSFTYKCHTFDHPVTGKRFKIKGVISCTSTNIIYLIKCVCGLAYVGKTLRALKTRMSEHRSDIRTKDFRNPVSLHFAEAKHCISSLKYIGIEQVKLPPRGGDINKLLLMREAFWISTLDTVNKGLNEALDIRPFL